jgi:hypothetical protein
MVVTSVVSGSATVDAELLAVVFTAVTWAVLVAAAGALVVDLLGDSVVAAAGVVVGSLVVTSAAPSVVEAADGVVVELLDACRGPARAGCGERVPEAVDDATAPVFDDAVVDVVGVAAAAADDEVAVLVVDPGPRAVCPVAAFEDPEFEVAELEESDAELLLVSSALATAATGLASDSPSTNAAIPALAPR